MNRIRFLRLLKGMKQADLAKKILVSQSSLSGYESGKFEPDSKTLLKLADLFHVSVDYLLGRDSSLTPKDPSLKKIPVYQHIQGQFWKRSPIIFYYQEVYLCQKGQGEYFGLYMTQDCMEPRICEGDLVIARKQSDIPNGSIAVVQIGHSEAVVKKICKLMSGEMVLISYNTKYEPDYYTAEQVASLPVQILGRVVEFRGMIQKIAE